jgi:oligogalacturonide lyase
MVRIVPMRAFAATLALTGSVIAAAVLPGAAVPQDAAAGPPILETGGASPMPLEWVDEDTGHRVVRLSRRQGPNRSFYFHNAPFLEGRDGGDLMVYYGATDQGPQLFVLDLETLESTQLTEHDGRISGEIVGPLRREVFYQNGDTVFATHVDTRETRVVFIFPPGYEGGISTLNADETLLAGVRSTPEKREVARRNPGRSFDAIFEARLPHTLFTIDINTAELTEVHEERAWLNHLQFSPTRRDLLMFCHEGPWHRLDRIWTLDLGTGEVTKIHHRTVDREIAGHEFWSRDGETIWYDLQIPRGETFYLAGADVATAEQTRYRMTRDEWSIHFNISPDQRLFAGDGGDPSQVAGADDGMWLYLFRPEGSRLVSERLVNLQHHDYELEPNVHFSPDGEWVIFRANFEGESQVYAVSIDAADE